MNYKNVLLVALVIVSALMVTYVFNERGYYARFQASGYSITQLEQPETPVVLKPAIEKKISAEEMFRNNARELNLDASGGQFEVIIYRIGDFVQKEGVQENHMLRIDIRVKNRGDTTATFYTEKAEINQRDKHYYATGGNFNGENLQPNEVRTGYLLFKKAPLGITGPIRIIPGYSTRYSPLFGTISKSLHVVEVNL